MDSACPRKCVAAAVQRPLERHELSQLSNIIRAEIALLQQTAFLCETCSSVYANSRSGTAKKRVLSRTKESYVVATSK